MNSRAKYWLVFLGVLIVATINFGSAFDNLFRDDDFVWLATAIGHHPLSTAFEPQDQFAFHRPFSIVLFNLEYRLFGFNGGLYILFNYLIHVLNSILLVAILAKLGLNRWTQVLASSLFLIGFAHYGKQIMWACTGAGLFAVTLALTTILLSNRWMEILQSTEPGKKQRSGITYALLILIFSVAAPGFHEIGFVVPFFLLLIAWHRLGSRVLRHPGVLLTAAAPVVVFGLMVFVLLRSAPTQKHLSTIEPGFVIRIVEYIGLMLLPIQRSEYFVSASPILKVLMDMARPAHFIFGAVFVGWTGYIIRQRQRADWFLTLWVYIALIPYCFVAMPDSWLELRYVYFAAIPMSALSAIFLTWLYSRKKAWAGTIAIVLCAGVIVGSLVLVRMLKAKYDRFAKNPTNTLRLEEIQQRSGADLED